MADPYATMGTYSFACREELRKLGVNESDIDYIQDAYGFGEGYERYTPPAREALALLREFRI